MHDSTRLFVGLYAALISNMKELRHLYALQGAPHV